MRGAAARNIVDGGKGDKEMRGRGRTWTLGGMFCRDVESSMYICQVRSAVAGVGGQGSGRLVEVTCRSCSVINIHVKM
jgi:hypothetical protein